MGTDHSPRDKQAHDLTDESLSLLENALREDEPPPGSGEHTEDVYSLLEEENALRRGRSAIGPHAQNVVHAR
jgi:1,6-anhydro-N-acetylmuramate kinase